MNLSKFAMRGNMLDMAIGVIIGGAFTGIVTSLTDNFINPILNFCHWWKNLYFTGYSRFCFSISFHQLVNFLIMAFVLFCIMKAV